LKDLENWEKKTFNDNGYDAGHLCISIAARTVDLSSLKFAIMLTTIFKLYDETLLIWLNTPALIIEKINEVF